MGLLVDGKWHDRWYDTKPQAGNSLEDAQFRSWVTPDGSAGPTGEAGFKAEWSLPSLHLARLPLGASDPHFS